MLLEKGKSRKLLDAQSQSHTQSHTCAPQCVRVTVCSDEWECLVKTTVFVSLLPLCQARRNSVPRGSPALGFDVLHNKYHAASHLNHSVFETNWEALLEFTAFYFQHRANTQLNTPLFILPNNGPVLAVLGSPGNQFLQSTPATCTLPELFCGASGQLGDV